MARGIPLLPQHESFCECIFVRAHALLMQYSTVREQNLNHADLRFISYHVYTYVSLVPSPFSRRERKGPGIHCLRMCKISLEFQGTVFFSNHFRILNAIWRWSSISLARGCGYARELWRLLLSVLLFPLLLPSP